MCCLFDIELKYSIIPVALFLTNDTIPYETDMLLRKEYYNYYYNSLIPYSNGYMIDSWRRKYLKD